MEEELEKLKKDYSKLEKRISQLEFRQELMMSDTKTDRVLLDYDITRQQYRGIMDTMDFIREHISDKDIANNSYFESEVERITDRQGDYHFCEYIAKAFMEDDRWEEVFPVLYGDMPKYKYLKEDKTK